MEVALTWEKKQSCLARDRGWVSCRCILSNSIDVNFSAIFFLWLSFLTDQKLGIPCTSDRQVLSTNYSANIKSEHCLSCTEFVMDQNQSGLQETHRNQLLCWPPKLQCEKLLDCSAQILTLAFRHTQDSFRLLNQALNTPRLAYT